MLRIIIEGAPASGKSTMARMLTHALQLMGLKVINRDIDVGKYPPWSAFMDQIDMIRQKSRVILISTRVPAQGAASGESPII